MARARAEMDVERSGAAHLQQLGAAVTKVHSLHQRQRKRRVVVLGRRREGRVRHESAAVELVRRPRLRRLHRPRPALAARQQPQVGCVQVRPLRRLDELVKPLPLFREGVPDLSATILLALLEECNPDASNIVGVMSSTWYIQ